MSHAEVLRGVAPYDGLVVVELADDYAGEYAGKLLGDLGADVIKIEPPDGATSRHTGPFADGDVGPNTSLAFWAYNTSKMSVVLGDTESGMARRAEMIASADVLLCTAQPAELAELNLDYGALLADHPRLVILSITPFGLTGPWADYRSCDLIALAAGGLLHSCGYDDHSIPPIQPGGNQGYQCAASFAHAGLLLALLERQRTGRGQLVDVSMHEANAVTGELANPYWFYPRTVVERQTCRHAQPVPTQPALFQCADGTYVYFALILADTHAWQALVSWMADADLAADLTDPAYDELAYRQEHFDHVQELVEVFFLLQDAETAYHEGQRRGLPIAPLRALEDLPQDEHLIARGFFTPVKMDDGRSVQYPGMPYRFSSFETRPGRPPLLGENTDEYRP